MHWARAAKCVCAATLLAATLGGAARAGDGETQPARGANQPVDEAYTAKIKKYTTEPYFTSPLVDYLPASKNVPTPEVVLGDVSGAPGILPYAEDVYKYMRLLEKASPSRVKVFTIGHTEEGREMIAVAVSSEANLKNLESNRAELAKLADPRTIKLNDAEADKIVARATPIYYITGTIHSPETGAPTALMELAYRLAVDESPYVKEIRDGVVTLITPVVEVDGRDRMVDIYKWHLSHPNDFYPSLIYWGKYVAHDNNRDAMGVTLKLTENVLNTYTTVEGAGAPRPARIRAVPIRQHRRRWPLQRLDRSDSRRRMADDRRAQRRGPDEVRNARRFHARRFRYMVARLSDVHRGDAQRHQPSIRNVWQRRRRHERAHARSGRVRAHLVQAKSAPAEDAVVAARQQQLRRDGLADFAPLLQRKQADVPEKFLHQVETLDSEAQCGRPRGVRSARRRSAF